MTKLEAIEKAIAELSTEELAKLRAFLDELDADLWDAQIERDAKAGKLDKLEARALENLKAGRVRDL
jgi:succinate dehydrogenase flavin-adding protein (antitoxin of CptAB toxin-antitoxin module)